MPQGAVREYTGYYQTKRMKVETMKYGYELYPVNYAETRYWIAQSRALIKNSIQNENQRTVYGQGSTMEAAVKDLGGKEVKWIEMAEYCGLKIVEPEKKAASSKKLSWKKRGIAAVVFLLCMMFGASSFFIDHKMLIGFFASLLFTTLPMGIMKAYNLKYTSFGYLRPMDKYNQYLEVFEKGEKVFENIEQQLQEQQ
jgi:hypothetical protein